VAHCNDADCAGGDESIHTADSATGAAGLFSSLVLDASGYPVVSYCDPVGAGLWVAHCNDANCAGANESLQAVDAANTGLISSLFLDASGYPVVAYYGGANGDLKVARCNDANCAGGDELIRTLDSAGDVGQGVALVLDASSHPVTTHYDDTNDDLRLTVWIG
jgi:hypothetical protein